MKAVAKLGWFVLSLFALANAILALRYLLPKVPFPAELDNFITRRTALELHALGGAIALLAGPLQFLPGFRSKHWTYHRHQGWVYCGGVLLGWLATLTLAPHAQTGWIASAGFLSLGTVWIVCTAVAVRYILKGDAAQHRRWMIRSYALTAAAITLRMYLPIGFAAKLPFDVFYPAVAWLCWVPNLLAVELFLRFSAAPSIQIPKAIASS
jgi:uncharacterized membrane protein